MKGVVGEAIASRWASLALLSLKYTRLSDATLPTPDGATQIDLVSVPRFGVFVIEVTNESGCTFGSEENRQWTQVFRSGEKFRFQNPLRQNYRHEKAVQQILKADRIPAHTIHSVVTLIGNATLKTSLPENATMGLDFARYAKSFRTPVLTDTQVRTARNAIAKARLGSTRQRHRKHLHHLPTRSVPSAELKCPECGKKKWCYAQAAKDPMQETVFGDAASIRRAKPR